MSSSDLPKLWTTSSYISKFVLPKSFFCVETLSNLSKKNFYEEYSTRRPTVITNVFEIYGF